MFRFIHSSDWQLGARFRQFGSHAETLRAARLKTLRRSLEVARAKSITTFLIADDLVEDNQVNDDLATQTAAMFGDFPEINIYLLPGNHDPASCPEAVWDRRALRDASAHVQVMIEPSAIDRGAEFPADAIKIDVTHDTLVIDGRHQRNDFPIALHAASRAGLVGTYGGRIVMPGTPEPDQFDQERSRNVALIEIAGPGQPPRVEPLPVATLRWKTLAFDFHEAESACASLEQSLAGLRPEAERTVLRVALSGTASPSAAAELRAWLDGRTKDFLICQVADATRVALDEAELRDLRTRHPILAQVLADIDQLEILATGQAPASAAPPSEAMAPLSLAEGQKSSRWSTDRPHQSRHSLLRPAPRARSRRASGGDAVILHATALRNVVPFLGDVRLGPFERGLNIIAAPNESRKTTALRADARALFGRHTTKDGEMKSLQPVGTDLGPRVAVEFETRTARYRIEKSFLQTPASTLWQ